MGKNAKSTNACMHADCRQDLTQQVHRPARYMHLQALAAELDAQVRMHARGSDFISVSCEHDQFFFAVLSRSKQLDPTE